MTFTENGSPLFGIVRLCLLLVDDANEMVNLQDHAAHRRGVRQFAGAPDLVELEPDQRRALRLMAADRAAGLLDLDRLCGRNATLAQGRLLRKASVIRQPPRRRHRYGGTGGWTP